MLPRGHSVQNVVDAQVGWGWLQRHDVIVVVVGAEEVETATNDDGSCEVESANPCPTDLNGDGQTTTSDLLIFLGAFGTDC